MSATNKTRVAIVLPYFGQGGAERMVALLASHIDLSCFSVRVFCIYGNPQRNVMERMVQDHGVEITFIGKGLGFSAGATLRLWRKLSEFSPRVVHTHLSSMVYCGPWCLVHRVKMLHTIHNIPEKEASSKMRQKMMRLYMGMGVLVPIAISEINRQKTASFYGRDRENVEMVVNPVDITEFYPKGQIDIYYDFINVARIYRSKNQKLLVEAMGKVLDLHPAAKLAIVGEGPLKEDLISFIREKGLEESVELLGRRDDIAGLMRLSRVYVMSSDYEGLPMSILEAMASGLPIVSTRVGGIADVVTDNGVLVDAGDSDALASAMSSILDDDDGRMKMGQRSREKAKSYSVECVSASYEELYAQYSR